MEIYMETIWNMETIWKPCQNLPSCMVKKRFFTSTSTHILRQKDQSYTKSSCWTWSVTWQFPKRVPPVPKIQDKFYQVLHEPSRRSNTKTHKIDQNSCQSCNLHVQTSVLLWMATEMFGENTGHSAPWIKHDQAMVFAMCLRQNVEYPENETSMAVSHAKSSGETCQALRFLHSWDPNQLVLKVSDFIQSLFSEDACPKSDKSATGMNTIFCHQIFSMSPARSARELGGSPFSWSTAS